MFNFVAVFHAGCPVSQSNQQGGGLLAAPHPSPIWGVSVFSRSPDARREMTPTAVSLLTGGAEQLFMGVSSLPSFFF